MEKQMNSCFLYVMAVSLVTTAGPVTTRAARDGGEVLEPLDGITKIVEWFKKLNEDFDQIVDMEKKGQLQRSIDRLRQSLFEVESDTKALKALIPDSRPQDDSSVGKLVRYNMALSSSIETLSSAVRELGADIMLYNGEEAAAALGNGIVAKGGALVYLDNSLAGGPWDGEAIRAKLDNGLGAIHEALLAVTEFERKLAAR
jgi:hypothetical protein